LLRGLAGVETPAPQLFACVYDSGEIFTVDETRSAIIVRQCAGSLDGALGHIVPGSWDIAPVE